MNNSNESKRVQGNRLLHSRGYMLNDGGFARAKDEAFALSSPPTLHVVSTTSECRLLCSSRRFAVMPPSLTDDVSPSLQGWSDWCKDAAIDCVPYFSRLKFVVDHQNLRSWPFFDFAAACHTLFTASGEMSPVEMVEWIGRGQSYGEAVSQGDEDIDGWTPEGTTAEEIALSTSRLLLDRPPASFRFITALLDLCGHRWGSFSETTSRLCSRSPARFKALAKRRAKAGRVRHQQTAIKLALAA
jgi:hypothetical protein